MKTNEQDLPVMSGRVEYCRQAYLVDPDACQIRRERWSTLRNGRAKITVHAVWRGQSVACLAGEIVRRTEPACPWLICIDGQMLTSGYDSEKAAKDAVLRVLAERIGARLHERISDSNLARLNAAVDRSWGDVVHLEKQLDAARKQAHVAQRLRDEFLEQCAVAQATAETVMGTP